MFVYSNKELLWKFWNPRKTLQLWSTKRWTFYLFGSSDQTVLWNPAAKRFSSSLRLKKRNRYNGSGDPTHPKLFPWSIQVVLWMKQIFWLHFIDSLHVTLSCANLGPFCPLYKISSKHLNDFTVCQLVGRRESSFPSNISK